MAGGDNYGDAPLIQSKDITDRVFLEIGDISPEHAGQEYWVRGRLHTSRQVGKGAFIVLRQSFHTVQCVAFQSATIAKGMIKYIGAIPLESIVDVKVEVSVWHIFLMP